MVFERKNELALVLLFLLSMVFSAHVNAQEDIINNGKVALKSGNSKELSKYFNDLVDLGFEGEKASYSKTQAEFVLKDFFKKYPPLDFQYVHKGASKEGLTYTIGNYNYNGGSFRVLIYIKQFNGNFLIDYLDFSKE